ncbi:MAG: restriction endonuclease [Chloroflexi bacterium]|nr:restriction endonuclease [Chloroflexota bacterium]
MPIAVPKYNELYNETLEALRNLDGSGTNQEIHDQAAVILNLTEEQIHAPLKPGSNRRNFDFQLGWAKTQLKAYGLLENSTWGVWALTDQGKATCEVDGKEVDRVVSEKIKQKKKAERKTAGSKSAGTDDTLTDLDDSALDEQWRDTLSTVLKKMDATAFERLCKRVLRESGFTKVENTPATRDGGIDGWGILPVGDFVTFRVVFQCKRYDGSVGPDVVQKLRGAMPGNADRGLIMTTGHFTTGAKQEAAHEHKTPIELVDGETLITRLKELKLGVSTRMVPEVTINPDFFANI